MGGYSRACICVLCCVCAFSHMAECVLDIEIIILIGAGLPGIVYSRDRVFVCVLT